LPGKWKEQQAGAAHQMKEKDDCDVASLMFWVARHRYHRPWNLWLHLQLHLLFLFPLDGKDYCKQSRANFEKGNCI
jgi:hypothetical protein